MSTVTPADAAAAAPYAAAASGSLVHDILAYDDEDVNTYKRFQRNLRMRFTRYLQAEHEAKKIAQPSDRTNPVIQCDSASLSRRVVTQVTQSHNAFSKSMGPMISY